MKTTSVARILLAGGLVGVWLPLSVCIAQVPKPSPTPAVAQPPPPPEEEQPPLPELRGDGLIRLETRITRDGVTIKEVTAGGAEIPSTDNLKHSDSEIARLKQEIGERSERMIPLPHAKFVDAISESERAPTHTLAACGIVGGVLAIPTFCFFSCRPFAGKENNRNHNGLH